eukprot:356634-Chlamydomonas_euryale.AAC.4
MALMMLGDHEGGVLQIGTQAREGDVCFECWMLEFDGLGLCSQGILCAGSGHQHQQSISGNWFRAGGSAGWRCQAAPRGCGVVNRAAALMRW